MKELRTLRQMEEKCGIRHVSREWWLRYLLQPALAEACDDEERATLRILQRVQGGNYRCATDLYQRANDMLLKQVLREVRQIAERDLTREMVSTKVQKLICCTDGLVNIAVMTRAEGNAGNNAGSLRANESACTFQCAQLRYIELYCTRLKNLVFEEDRKTLPPHPLIEDYFENLYWRKAALRNGRPSEELKLFENTYRADLLSLARRMQGVTVEERMLNDKECGPALREQLRQFDVYFNVLLPAALSGKAASATRRFFPFAWHDSIPGAGDTDVGESAVLR